MRWAQVTAFTITVRVKRLYKSVNMMLLESVVWTTFLFTFMKASIPEMGPTETPDMESGSGMILTGKCSWRFLFTFKSQVLDCLHRAELSLCISILLEYISHSYYKIVFEQHRLLFVLLLNINLLQTNDNTIWKAIWTSFIQRCKLVKTGAFKTVDQLYDIHLYDIHLYLLFLSYRRICILLFVI